MVVVYFLVVMTSNWVYSAGPFGAQDCARMIATEERALDAAPRAFFAKVQCMPHLMAPGDVPSEMLPRPKALS